MFFTPSCRAALVAWLTRRCPSASAVWESAFKVATSAVEDGSFATASVSFSTVTECGSAHICASMLKLARLEYPDGVLSVPRFNRSLFWVMSQGPSACLAAV